MCSRSLSVGSLLTASFPPAIDIFEMKDVRKEEIVHSSPQEELP